MAEVLLKDIMKIYPYVDRGQKKDKQGKKTNLQITSKGVVAVQQFNLDIKDKEFVVLVGPSGCGKSTTLRMIAGLEQITSGDLYIDGNLVNAVEPKDRDIAMVFQNYALYPHMTVYQNMAYSLKVKKFLMEPTEDDIRRYQKRKAEFDKAVREHKLNGTKAPKEPVARVRHLRRKEIDLKVREAAEILDITEYLKRKPKNLSGGQRQRVAIGRAIVRKPKALLMDEPLSNLDAKLRNIMRAELIKLRKKIDTTFIYVTHDQTEAMTLGDRIVCMKDGYIQQIGTPQEVFDHPRNLFVSGFIGTPQMNYFYGEIVKDNDGKYFINYKGINVDKTAMLAEEFGHYYLFPNRHEILERNLEKDEDRWFDLTSGEAVEINIKQLIKFNGKNYYYPDVVKLPAEKIVYDEINKTHTYTTDDGAHYILENYHCYKDDENNMFLPTDLAKTTVNADEIYDGFDYKFIIGSTHRFEICEEKQARLAENNIQSQKIIIGVRPDHMNVTEDGISGIVDVSELMGTCIHLHINLEGKQTIAIVPNNGVVSNYLGKEIKLSFNGNVVHMFDPETKLNLEYLHENNNGDSKKNK